MSPRAVNAPSVFLNVERDAERVVNSDIKETEDGAATGGIGTGQTHLVKVCTLIALSNEADNEAVEV